MTIHQKGLRTMRYTLAAILAALLIVPASLAATGLSASSTANGTEAAGGSTYTHEDVAVSWVLDANEYACSVTVTTDVMERNMPLSPTSTSAIVGIAAQPGTTITVRLQVALVSSTTLPDDACFQQRTIVSTSTIAATPPPPPVETTTIATSTTPAPVATTPITLVGPSPADLQAQIDALQAKLDALAKRVDAIAQANVASWDAMVAALQSGASTVDAALAARSAGLNAIYELGV